MKAGPVSGTLTEVIFISRGWRYNTKEPVNSLAANIPGAHTGAGKCRTNRSSKRMDETNLDDYIMMASIAKEGTTVMEWNSEEDK